MGHRLVPAFAFVALLFATPARVANAQPPVLGPEIWSLVDPGLAPRYGHTITYDPVGNCLILFGGAIDVVSSPNELNDVWELSLSAPLTWRRLQPTGTPPPPRYDHTAVYDAPNQRILIFGGSGDHLTENADVWALSLAGTPSWSHLIPGGTAPGTFHSHVAIYDPVGQRMIVYGGNGTFSASGEIRILSLAGTPTWSAVTPPGFTSEWRRSATATYDPVGQRMVVIGGGTGSNSTPAALSLSLSGTLQWSVLAANGVMRDLHNHSAVYDPDDNSILAFGGFQVTGIENKTWRLSLGASPAWSAVTPLGALPRRRLQHAAGWDPVAHRMLVFGGNVTTGSGDATEDEQELWSFTPGGDPAWQELDPDGAQPKRGYRAVMTADPLGQRMLVTGGNLRDGVFSNQAHGRSTTGEQLWHPFGATGTPPTGRAGHTTIVDAANQRLVLFGGQTDGGQNIFAVYSNEVWVAPLGSDPVWTQLTPAGGPPAPRSDHSAIYDGAHQRMIVFGGVDNNGSMNDIWSLSLDANPTWTPLVPSGFPPSPRHAHSAIYDAPRNRMIVYAGASGGGIFSGESPLGDLRAMALDGSNLWSVLTPPGFDPPDRYGHNAIYDPVGQRMVVFGGQTSTGMKQDAWSLALWKPGASWKQLHPLGTLPSVRSFSASDYDDAGGRMYVFGGGTPVETRPLFDTWTLTLNSCAPPIVTAQPTAATQPFGTTASFSVTATGAVAYRWQKDGVNMTDGGRVSGALTSTLSIASFQASDVATYRAQVFGACDTVLTDAVALAEGCVAGQANPPAHMAAWWAMDPGVGNSVPDVLNTKSNKNHASLTGNATLVPAIIGTALRCNGVNDGLHVPSTLSPELAKNASGLSIDAWIYPRSGSSPSAYRMVLAKGLLAHSTVKVNGADQLVPGYALYLHGGGQLGFQMPDNDYNPVRIEPVLPPMTMDTWHHVAVALTPAPGGGGLFVDGARVHTFTPPSAIIGNLADLYIGRFPPQLGPAAADSAFNGDIDEVEVFTAAVPDVDVHALWVASCAGKRREIALLPVTVSIPKSTAQAEVCGSIGNFKAVSGDYNWTLQVLGGCASVPVSFTPSSGSMTVGTGDFGTVTSTATIDAPLTDPFEACYRLTVTDLADGSTFTADGRLVYSGSPLSGKGDCTPPTVGLAAGDFAARAAGPRVAATGGWSFTVTNDSTDAVQLDYWVEASDPGGNASSLIALNGLPPGTPTTGSVLVPALGSVDVPVTVALADHEPFVRDQIVLRADLDGDLVPEAIASSFVRSLEDTSLALLAVGPRGTRPPVLSVSPNPFRALTNIDFVLPESRKVDVAVYDILGRRVRTLRTGTLPAGAHRVIWDGRREGGTPAAGGLYFVRVVAGTERWTMKVAAMR